MMKSDLNEGRGRGKREGKVKKKRKKKMTTIKGKSDLIGLP